MARDTGFPTADAENDFARQRRRADVARLVSWLRREPDDVNAILPFDEVVAALGKVGEKSLGLQVVTIESIVGSVDRTGDFDRYFRPTSTHSRARWERLAVAQRRGESVPPVQLYRVGSMHFVIDGHHRVSIACAMHQKTIDAYVTEIITRISPEGITQRADLLIKDHRRLFLTRVPLQALNAKPSRSPTRGSTPNSVSVWRRGVFGSCRKRVSFSAGTPSPGAGSARSFSRSCEC